MGEKGETCVELITIMEIQLRDTFWLKGMLVECRIVHDRRLIFVQSTTARMVSHSCNHHLHHYHHVLPHQKVSTVQKEPTQILTVILCINSVTLIMNLMKIRISITGKYFSKMQKSLLNIEHQSTPVGSAGNHSVERRVQTLNHHQHNYHHKHHHILHH